MILFIDDERRDTDSYVRELEMSGFTLSFQTDVEIAWKFFEDNQDKIDLIILDIMMPPKSMFKPGETEDGLRTGTKLYERIRKSAPDLTIIILTNITDKLVIDYFSNESKCYYLRKEELLEFELVEEVKKILGYQKILK